MSYTRVEDLMNLPDDEPASGMGWGSMNERAHGMNVDKHIRSGHIGNIGFTDSFMRPGEVQVPIQKENYETVSPQKNYMDIPCIDIANHIQGCPICSKFYKNDNSLHIITILILSIVCILLLKKVLNV